MSSRERGERSRRRKDHEGPEGRYSMGDKIRGKESSELSWRERERSGVFSTTWLPVGVRVDPGGFRETKRVITCPRASAVPSNPLTHSPTPFAPRPSYRVHQRWPFAPYSHSSIFRVVLNKHSGRLTDGRGRHCSRVCIRMYIPVSTAKRVRSEKHRALEIDCSVIFRRATPFAVACRWNRRWNLETTERKIAPKQAHLE